METRTNMDTRWETRIRRMCDTQSGRTTHSAATSGLRETAHMGLDWVPMTLLKS